LGFDRGAATTMEGGALRSSSRASASATTRLPCEQEMGRGLRLHGLGTAARVAAGTQGGGA
jgi:hypothetical protein